MAPKKPLCLPFLLLPLLTLLLPQVGWENRTNRWVR